MQSCTRGFFAVLLAAMTGCADSEDSTASSVGSSGAGTGGSGGGPGGTGGSTSSAGGSSGVRPAPAWVGDLAEGEWAIISLNKLVDVDSAVEFGFARGAPWSSCEGISGIIDDWNGGALASNYGEAGALLVWGGGHCGYGGSDVYGFDLADQLWKRISNPYGSADPDADVLGVVSDIGTFPDGSPIPTHTYDLVEYQPTTNSLVLLSAYTSVPGTTHVGIAHHLNLDHLTADAYSPTMWKRSEVNVTGSVMEGGMSCYDRNRDVFWIWQVPSYFDSSLGDFTNEFCRYDPNVVGGDGTVGEYENHKGDGSGFNGGGGAACDPLKDLFVFTFFQGGDSSSIYYRDLTNPSVGATKLTQVSSGPAVSSQNGWEYSDVRNGFLYWNGGTDVWLLEIADSPNREFTTATWTNISQGGVEPEMNVNGNWSRFRVAKFDLNGAIVEVAVMVGNVGENTDDGHVYAFRVPAASP